MKLRLVLSALLALAPLTVPPLVHAQDADNNAAVPEEKVPALHGTPPLTPEQATAQTAAVRELIKRWLPRQADRFVLETIPPDTNQGNPADVFEIQSQDNKIVLRGNNGPALASAFNYYLRNYGGSMVAWDGMDQVNVPAALPAVTPKVRITSPWEVRYAYSPLIFAYAMPYATWGKWEREIDFLALNGINRALVLPGQEAVWQAVWRGYGYSDAEIRQWLVPPAHAPWQTMGALENTGGPLPQSVIDARAKLGKQIAARMRELGIEPILPGYAGIVPPGFDKKLQGTPLLGQSNWNNLDRPDYIDPTAPQFAEVADKYYAALKNVFGDAKYFAMYPFFFGAKPGEIKLPFAGKAMVDAMQHANPDAIWVAYSTQDDPPPAIMAGILDKEKQLNLDAAADRTELWRNNNTFEGAPWVWSIMQNEGGKTGLFGDFNAPARGPLLAYASEKPGLLAGIGLTAQSNASNAAYFDIMLENVWRTKEQVQGPWMLKYARRRYGAVSAKAEQAWTMLRGFAYAQANPTVPQTVTGRPYLIGPQVKPNDESHQRFDIAMHQGSAWKAMIDAAPDVDKLAGAEPYRHDLVDIGSQALTALAGRYQVEASKAYRARDKEALKLWTDKLLGTLHDMDDLLATRREFMAGTWVEDAKRWGTTPEEKAVLELDAKTILTTWSLPVTMRDSGARAWSGLINTYYLPRWQAWTDGLREALDAEKPFDDRKMLERITTGEAAWPKAAVKLPYMPSGDALAISKKLYDKYAPDFALPPAGLAKSINGQWTPTDLSTDRTLWTYDITAQIIDVGEYEAEFKFTGGKNALLIYGFDVVQDNKVIFEDAHDGRSGAVSRDNIYKFNLRPQPNQKILVRAEVSGEGGFDSTGEIIIRRAKRKDLRPVP